MSEDIIKVEVDTTELDVAIAKAKQLSSIGARMTGTTDLPRGTKKLWKDWNSFLILTERAQGTVPDLLRKFGETDLPSVNRELRLILGQIPGMRNLINSYFRLKRIQRSVGIATEEASTLKAILANPQFVLTTIATLILLVKSMATYFERLKRERIAYEEFLRREKGLSKREFDTLRAATGEISGGGAGTRGNYFWSIPG